MCSYWAIVFKEHSRIQSGSATVKFLDRLITLSLLAINVAYLYNVFLFMASYFFLTYFSDCNVHVILNAANRREI